MRKKFQGVTIFTIAHRLATIIDYDKIIVLDKGNIVEVGNHSNLMRAENLYYRLYTARVLEESSLSAD